MEPAGLEGRVEEDVEERVLLLLGEGRAVPAGLVDALRAARVRAAESLRGQRADEAQAALGAMARDLEEGVRRLEEGEGKEPAAAIRQALALGERLRWCVWLGDLTAGEPRRDPLSAVESELDWVELGAGEIERRDASLAAPAGEVQERLREARSSLLGLKATRSLESREPPAMYPPLQRAAFHWQVVEETFGIEAASKAAELEGETGLGAPGREALARRRREALGRARAAVEEAGTAGRREFFEHAAAGLSDSASAVLAEAAASRSGRRLPLLQALQERVGALLEVVGRRQASSAAGKAAAREERGRERRQLRRLRRLRRRAAAAEEEQEAYLRLERYFGPGKVRLFESFILCLIVLFLGLVVIEWRLPGDSAWLPPLHAADFLLCVFFQIDFFVRWGFAGWRRRYFLRHFFLESLPAIPFGFLAYHYGLGALEEARVVIAARALRLRNVLLPAVRLFRVVVFLVRGSDRAVETSRRVFDRDVVVFDPTPAAEASESPLERRLLRLESAHLDALHRLYLELEPREKAPLLAAYVGFLEVEARLRALPELPHGRAPGGVAHEVHLERIIHGFLDCNVARVLGVLGRDGARRVALWLRFLDLPLLRHAPIVRRLVPAARLANPVEAAAAAAQAVGQVLQDLLAVLHFWGDLSGISTGPQILDRIGTAVVTATKRPAVRLLVFGGFFLLVEGIAELLGFSVVEIAARYLGLPILILGSTCLVLFLLGRWFKRIAGEALDVYLRTADAHFFLLLKGWKLDRAPADIARLARSVFLPERKLRGDGGAGDQEWLAFLEEPIRNDQTSTSYLKPPSDPRLLPFAEDREVVTLLYRDFLDGPILHREDDKTSVQLLGNLEIQEIRLRTLGLTRKDIRKLEHLDLVKERLLSLGPYFWFRFISESLAIETAKLVMEYNTSCIPLARLPLATPAARRRFESFLESHRGRWDVSARETGRGGAANADGLLTDDFTALCFLGADPALDDKIARRFGEKVLAALRRDRRGVVRDIFGTRPYHLLPRERRVINPYRLYHRYLGGAKVFLLPFVVAFACVRAVLLGLGGLLGLVQEVLGRKRVLRGHASRAAGFGVAVRKINRMRKPFFMEALRLRAAVDIEYLGLRLPGCEGAEGGSTHVEDLDFVGAVASERRPIEALRAAAVRDLRRFRNFLAARGWLAGGMEDLLRALDPGGALQERRGEVVRALVTAYITDHDSLRSLITARGAARAFVEEALERRETAVRRLEMLLGSLMVFLPRVRRGRRLFREYVAVGGDLGHLSPRARRKALRRFLWAGPRVERSLALAVDCARRAAAGEDAILQSLRGVARDYASWTRKIVTLRSIQAITVLDIQAYRDLVWKVGAYAEDGV